MSNSVEKNLIIKVISVSVIMLLLSYSVIFILVRGVIDEEFQNNMIRQARAVTVQMEHVRHYISGMVKDEIFDPNLLKEAQKYIKRKNAHSTEEIIKVAKLTRFYRTIPIVSSWSIGQRTAPDALYQFRVVRIGARNPKHEASPVEREMLEMMASNDLDEHWIIDEADNSMRYMRAITMKKECLACHGVVADYPKGNGYDSLGIKMEGWALGEQRGAFEIISDLKPLQEAVRRVQHALIGIGVIMLILLIFSAPIWFNMLRTGKEKT
jgi:methyl-accepting chemotaxis protein